MIPGPAKMNDILTKFYLYSLPNAFGEISLQFFAKFCDIVAKVHEISQNKF
jgi:hypothetical protein